MQGLTTQDIASQVCHISDGAIPNVIAGLETKYLRDKYYMENFTYVVRESGNVRDNNSSQLFGTSRIIIWKPFLFTIPTTCTV